MIENTNAGYISVRRLSFAGMPLKINAGVREEFTNLTSIGIGQLPTALTVQPSDHTAFLVAFGPQSPVSGNNSYQYLLPNLDMALSVTDDLQIRFDASRTLTRPPLNHHHSGAERADQPACRFAGRQWRQSGPDALPVGQCRSERGMVLPAELLCVGRTCSTRTSPTSLLRVTQQTINGVIDPTTGCRALHGDHQRQRPDRQCLWRRIRGAACVRATAASASRPTPRWWAPTSPTIRIDLSIGGFAVTGLANSANLVGFYDKDGFQARIAANWRDGFLISSVRGRTVRSSAPSRPSSMPAPRSTSAPAMTSRDQFNVYFTAQNLNDATYSTHGRFSDQPLDVVDYGRRFTMGVHFKY